MLIRGRRLFSFLSQMRRLFEGALIQGGVLIRVNTVCEPFVPPSRFMHALNAPLHP